MMKFFVMVIAVLFGLVCSRSVPNDGKRSAEAGICKGYHSPCTTRAECCSQFYCSKPYTNSSLMCIPEPPVIGCNEICQTDSECCPNYKCKQYCRPEGTNCSEKDESACKLDPMFRDNCPRKCGTCHHRCVKNRTIF